MKVEKSNTLELRSEKESKVCHDSVLELRKKTYLGKGYRKRKKKKQQLVQR